MNDIDNSLQQMYDKEKKREQEYERQMREDIEFENQNMFADTDDTYGCLIFIAKTVGIVLLIIVIIKLLGIGNINM